MKRHVVETLERRKEQIIAAFWANDGMNDDKGTRQSAIEEIEQNFDEAVQTVLGSAPAEEEIDESNPFFAPVKKARETLEGHLPDHDAETVQKMIEEESEYTKYIDQS